MLNAATRDFGSLFFYRALRADLLWEHGSGGLALWEMNGTMVEGGGSLGIKPVGWSLLTLGQLVG